MVEHKGWKEEELGIPAKLLLYCSDLVVDNVLSDLANGLSIGRIGVLI